MQEPVRSYAEPDLWVLDLQPGAAPKNLTANYDYDVNSGVGGDNRCATGCRASVAQCGARTARTCSMWSPSRAVRSWSLSMPTTGKVQELSRGDQAVEQFATSDDGKVVVMNVSTPTMIDELFVLNQTARSGRLPISTRPLFSELNLTQPGRDVVHQLRRQKDSGLDSEAA